MKQYAPEEPAGGTTASGQRTERNAFAWNWRSWLFVILSATFTSVLLKQTPSCSDHAYPLASSMLASFVYSATVGSLMLYTASQSWGYISRCRFPLHEILLVSSILVPAALGTLISGWFVIAIGQHSANEYVAMTRSSFRFSLMLSLVFGISFYLYESVKGKLEAATMQLHTRQLEQERARKLAIAAQLSSLESRVRPHFLFNTLNSISSLIREQPDRAERMVEQLAALLRSSLDSDGKQTVPLGRELKLVNDYLAIEQARFSSRLRFSFDVPDELNGVAVPPFAVQTLVENCVKHVVARRRTGAEITVTAGKAGEDMLLVVHDDGPGFSPAAIREGHGLDILLARLRSLYGDRGRLDFATNGSGATVSIIVPWNQRN